MADRDQSWGFGGRDRGRERGRREDERATRWSEGERRSFDESTRHGPGTRGRRFEGGDPWGGETRDSARYDRDLTGYGGQEYGMEGGRAHREGQDRGRDDRDERETWRPGRGEPYGDLELNPRNRGVDEFGPPHDYAYHPQAGHEFDPDYLRWREEQLRGHDRDYGEWRKHQQGQYDEDYRRFRSERREHFGRTFQDWRSQRSAVGGREDLSVAPGVSGYGSKTAIPGGYDRAGDKPSGMIEPMTAMNASPGAGQGSGGSYEASGSDGGSSGGDSSPEFGKAPPQVQAAAGGWDGRGAPEDKVAKDQARMEDERAKAEERRADEQAKDEKKR